MAISFPTGLDNFTNPSSGNTLDSPSHSLQHSDLNDAVEALETKLGVGASPAGSATSGYVLMAGSGGTTTWSALPTQSSGLNQIVASSVTVTGSGSSGSVNSNGLITFASCTDVIAKGIFSSTYNNYKVIININNTTADAQLRLKFHDGTNPSSTGYTYVSYSKTAGGADTSFGGSNDTSLFVFGMETYTNNWYGNFTTEIYNPFKTESTFWNSYHSNIPENGTWNVAFGGGNHSPETSYTALEIYPTSGAISGTIAVYGFRI